MSGIDIVGALLLEDAGVLELVAEESIKAGMLPDAVLLPALLIREVSSLDRQTLGRGQTVRTMERVSVLVRSSAYEEAKEVLRRVRECLRGRTGDVGGGSSVSILTAGRGPDLMGPGNTFEQTHDYRVSFDA